MFSGSYAADFVGIVRESWERIELSQVGKLSLAEHYIYKALGLP